MGEMFERVKGFFKSNKEKIKKSFTKAVVVSFIIGVTITAVACSDQTNDQDLDQNTNPGIENPIGGGEQTGTQTPSTPTTPDVPVTPDVPDVPVTPDIPDEPTTPDVPDEPVTPEKTEAEYQVECEEKLKEIALTALNNSNEVFTFSNVELEKVNAETGTIYCFADSHLFSVTERKFFEIKTNQTFSETSYKNALDIINNIDANLITEIENQTILAGKVSEEKYNDLCEYVLGEVGLEGAEVLNATQFSILGGGMDNAVLTAIKNGKVYEISASSHSGTASGAEDKIDYMLNSSTNKIKITSEENFEDFDAIGVSLENMSFKHEINGEEVSMKLVKGENGKYSLDFNFCSFGDDGFGF